jgi:hypothetical protein
VRPLALALPGVEEGTSYGTQAFRVRGKFFARLREDGDSLVLKCNVYERRYLVEDMPEVFYVTDHYRDYPAVLVRLSAVAPALLRERLEASWRAGCRSPRPPVRRRSGGGMDFHEVRRCCTCSASGSTRGAAGRGACRLVARRDGRIFGALIPSHVPAPADRRP